MELRQAHYGPASASGRLSVESHGAPAARRLRRVSEGAWAAAFIRGADRSPDLVHLPLRSD
ncbi:hypothetical protein ABR738_35145 [Streptomyces sp. Edi4]|uniref:hypothetical protein n=1 Tax=Streptomyces sp. Edi4 TaxID=3162527 RepID=UPI003306916B